MSTIKNTKFNKSLLKVVAIIGTSIPLLTMTFGRPAMAQSSSDPTCIDVISVFGQNVEVCAEEKGQGYDIYTKVGPATSPKQYIGRDGGCATFGTITIAGSHVQARGCVKRSPMRLEGNLEACAFRRCSSKNFTLNLPGSSVNSEKSGYELFFDGVRVGFEPSWTRQQAIANLILNHKNHPNKKVEGLFNGQKIGYELFFDGVRVGFEPAWTRQQAISNLQWNQKNQPNRQVEGLFNGEKL